MDELDYYESYYLKKKIISRLSSHISENTDIINDISILGDYSFSQQCDVIGKIFRDKILVLSTECDSYDSNNTTTDFDGNYSDDLDMYDEYFDNNRVWGFEASKVMANQLNTLHLKSVHPNKSPTYLMDMITERGLHEISDNIWSNSDRLKHLLISKEICNWLHPD